MWSTCRKNLSSYQVNSCCLLNYKFWLLLNGAIVAVGSVVCNYQILSVDLAFALLFLDDLPALKIANISPSHASGRCIRCSKRHRTPSTSAAPSLLHSLIQESSEDNTDVGRIMPKAYL